MSEQGKDAERLEAEVAALKRGMRKLKGRRDKWKRRAIAAGWPRAEAAAGTLPDTEP